MEQKTAKKEKRLQSGQSFSEPDLTTADGSRSFWPGYPGFPPGFTVDELRWYRKKKPPGEWGPKDNLKPYEGSMKKYKSEYKKRFKFFKFLLNSNESLNDSQENLVEKRIQIRPDNYLKLEGDLEYRPEYKEIFKQYPFQREERFHGPLAQLQLEGLLDTTTEHREKYIPFNSVSKAPLIKRSAALGPEGEFMVKSSEMHSQFVRHEMAPGAPGVHRAEVVRRATSLKLEGDLQTSTETSDRYVAAAPEARRRRSKLAKIPTSLKLEGDLDTQTENNDKFVAFELPPRTPLTKKSTNLRLEGPMEIQTEHQEKFVPINLHANMDIKSENQENTKQTVPFELSSKLTSTKRPVNLQTEVAKVDVDKKTNFTTRKRPPLNKKDTNLHLEGDLILAPEYRDAYIEYHIERPKPKRPVNNLGIHLDEPVESDKKRDKLFQEYIKPFRPFDTRPDESSYRMEKTLSRKPKENLKPEGTIDLTTENQSKYKEHNVNELSIKKPIDCTDTKQMNIKQKRTRIQVPEGNLKTEGKMETTAEYKSSYVDFPRERPVLKKPQGSLKPEGNVSHLSEKSAAYVSHSNPSKASLSRPDDNINLGSSEMEEIDGRFECQPEYRRAYVDFIQRENITRKSRTFPPNIDTASLSRIPLPTSKRYSSKSPTASAKSRSVSPPDAEKRRKSRQAQQVPRTPAQQRVLVPDMGSFVARRPSSIFGPKTGRYFPQEVTSSVEDDFRQERCRSCCQGCHKCANASRWQSPCGRQPHVSTREHSPSPTRQIWTSHRHSHHRPRSRNRAEHHQQAASFVVLTDKVEINNNHRLLNELEEMTRYGGCCKEQKWMPSWYDDSK